MSRCCGHKRDFARGWEPRDSAGRAIVEIGVWGESRWGSFVWSSESVPETLTLGESRLGAAALGSAKSPARFEAILAIIGSGSFPKSGQRDSITHGQRKQLRDAMILEAHARERRDVLVTNDRRAFIGPDYGKRAMLEDLCATKIRTVDEFCREIATLA